MSFPSIRGEFTVAMWVFRKDYVELAERVWKIDSVIMIGYVVHTVEGLHSLS